MIKGSWRLDSHWFIAYGINMAYIKRSLTANGMVQAERKLITYREVNKYLT